MTKSNKIISAALALALVAGNAAPALARAVARDSETAAGNQQLANENKNTTDKDAAKITELKDKAAREIDRRITSLNTLNTRIQAMKKVTDAQKKSLDTSIKNQIAALTELKSKIQAETDLAKLRTEVKSVTGSYRIFALVIPQGTIIAAADRALTLADQMTTLGNKLKERIATAKTAGKDVAALEKSLESYNANIADAKKLAQEAIDLVSNLAPDNGDKTKMESNLKTMKDAKAKIQAAHQKFVAARKDAKDIAQGLKKLGKNSASETTASEN